MKVDILLIEDDARDIELTLYALSANGITSSVEIARDGREALELLYPTDRNKSACRPRCILLDLKMPKISGLDLLKIIREHSETKLTPVVVLTSSRESSDLHSAYSLGANSYLCKPLEFSDFTEMLKSFGDYWTQLNEIAA